MESELGHQTLTNMFTNNETLKQSPIYQPLGMQDEDYPSNFITKRKHLLVGNITHVFAFFFRNLKNLWLCFYHPTELQNWFSVSWVTGNTFSNNICTIVDLWGLHLSIIFNNNVTILRPSENPSTYMYCTFQHKLFFQQCQIKWNIKLVGYQNLFFLFFGVKCHFPEILKIQHMYCIKSK